MGTHATRQSGEKTYCKALHRYDKATVNDLRPTICYQGYAEEAQATIWHIAHLMCSRMSALPRIYSCAHFTRLRESNEFDLNISLGKIR